MSDIIIIEFISNQKRGLQVTNYIVIWGGSVVKPVVCRMFQPSTVICHVTFETLKLEPYIVTTPLTHLSCQFYKSGQYSALVEPFPNKNRSK